MVRVHMGGSQSLFPHRPPQNRNRTQGPTGMNMLNLEPIRKESRITSFSHPQVSLWFICHSSFTVSHSHHLAKLTSECRAIGKGHSHLEAVLLEHGTTLGLGPDAWGGFEKSKM